MPRRHRPGYVGRRQLDRDLAEVDELTEGRHWVEARDQLEELEQRYPNNAEILGELLDVSYELHDMRTYLEVCQRLLKLNPNDADLTLALAGAYMANVRPASALSTFRLFLQQWPQHERVAETRKTVTDLEAKMNDILRDLGLTGDAGLEIARLHERTLGLLEQGHYRQARETAEQLLGRYPDFLPAFNNIAQSYCAGGDVARAISTTERVLTQHPDNYHALVNMVHYHCIKGDFEQAHIYAERLKMSESIAVGTWVRKAEAAAYLGDDQAVVDAFNGAERAGHLKPPLGDPLLLHLAAAAQMRLGDEPQARKLWKRALAIAPGFDLAKENLDDLRNPIGERHAPWFFEQGNWITPRFAEDLRAMLKRYTRKSEHAVADATRQFIQQHSELVALAPVLLDRGDVKSRELAFHLAEMARTPEMLAALRDFGLSQRGPDSMRHSAMQIASEAGLIPEGPVRMWMKGSWREVMLLSYELHDEPTFQHSRQIEKWFAESIEATRARDLDRAEELLQRGLAAEPDAPDLLNNLATVYELRGRRKEAEALLRQLIEKHLDYGFPRINLARYCIQRGDLEQAEALLKPLRTRKRFNFSEFGFLCSAQMELLLARSQADGAREWLEMWQSLDPENPLVADWQRRLSRRNPMERLLGRT
ncbi:MAG: tetratricopeptide repeat protein [Chloroflexi bacterium]|nr:tetratricopeptide repeat protein [Chloroflexota bacterium]